MNTTKQHNIWKNILKMEKNIFWARWARKRAPGPQDPKSQRNRAVNNSRRHCSYVFIFTTLLNINIIYVLD